MYARDVARLPEWERRLWAGFNLTPEGKVCAELLAAQVRAEPANTQAPEACFPQVLAAMADAWHRRFGSSLLRNHDETADIGARIHGFRAIDRTGLLSLAKDTARLTADSIDASATQIVAPPAKGERFGSLKSFERALATICGGEHAHKVVGPPFAAYDLRLSDAHLPKSGLLDAFDLLGIAEEYPPLKAGYKLLRAVVSSLHACTMVLLDRFPGGGRQRESGK